MYEIINSRCCMQELDLSVNVILSPGLKRLSWKMVSFKSVSIQPLNLAQMIGMFASFPVFAN